MNLKYRPGEFDTMSDTMTNERREAIREGLNGLIGDCMISIGCESSCPKQEAKELEAQEECLDAILAFLSDNGVVLKVDDPNHVNYSDDKSITPTAPLVEPAPSEPQGDR